jgi:hypothetical protein
MSNVVITSTGLTSAAAASNLGPLLAIKYFLPVYDYRSDPNIQTSASLWNISACMSATDTSPFGEILWNVEDPNAYSLSLTDDYILSGASTTHLGTTNWVVSNALQRKQAQINFYNGTPLSQSISGSYVDFNPSVNTWNVSAAGATPFSNAIPTETSTGTERFFEIVDYYPVTTGNEVRGSFKAKLNKNIGTCKFNKVALYGIIVDVDGSEIHSDPFLFAEAMVDNPIIKTDFGAEGFDDVVFDIQISLHSLAATWTDVFFGTSADYWEKTPGGLYTPEKVGIGTFIDSIKEPQAKLEIKSSDYNQLRIAYDDTYHTDFNTNASGNLTISATGGVIIPVGELDLGTSTSAFAQVYLSGSGDRTLDIENGRMIFGKNYGITLADMPITITSGASLSGAFIGGDLVRTNDDLFLITKTSSLDQNICIIPGISMSNSSYAAAQAITGQVGPTHKNVEKMIELDSFGFLTGVGSINLIPGSGFILTRGNIYPTVAGTYNLGNSNLYWGQGYFETIGGKSQTIKINKHLVPYSSSTPGDIGASTNRWNAGYFKNLDVNDVTVNTAIEAPSIIGSSYVGSPNGYFERSGTIANGHWDTSIPAKGLTYLGAGFIDSETVTLSDGANLLSYDTTGHLAALTGYSVASCVVTIIGKTAIMNCLFIGRVKPSIQSLVLVFNYNYSHLNPYDQNSAMITGYLQKAATTSFTNYCPLYYTAGNSINFSSLNCWTLFTTNSSTRLIENFTNNDYFKLNCSIAFQIA